MRPLPPPPLVYDVGKRYSAVTPQDIIERRQHAMECWVFRMRCRGERLPPLQVDEPLHGLLLPVKWSATQYQLQLHPVDSDLCGGLEAWLAMMLDATRVRRSDDRVQLYQGHEWVPADARHWPQTWLCTPTLERGREILQAMIDRPAWQRVRHDAEGDADGRR